MARPRKGFRPIWSKLHAGNFGISTLRRRSATYGRHPAIVWRHWRPIAKGSTRSESTISFGCVLFGRAKVPPTSRSWIITRREHEMAKKLRPMHPGEVLREEFLVPL